MVSNYFNKAHLSYDTVSHIQKKSAETLVNQLIRFLPDFKPESILDIGTGTGYIPQLLYPYFSDSQYLLNDISPNMLDTVKINLNAHHTTQYNLSNMDNTDFDHHSLIISNLAFQWSDNLMALLQKLYTQSNVLAFSCLLSGTFSEWDKLFTTYNIPSPVYPYPDKITLEKFLVSLHPRPTQYYFKTKRFNLFFKNAHEFLVYLKKLGANKPYQTVPLSTLKKIIREQSKPLNITYKIFYGILKS